MKRFLLQTLLAAGLLLLFAVGRSEAGRVAISIKTIANLPATCEPEGHAYIVTDSNVQGDDCSSGGGSTIAWCFCNSAGNGYDFQPQQISAADIIDQDGGTDITTDLEEEAHASEHSGQGTVANAEAIDLKYSDTLAADPTFSAEDAVFSNDGTSAGGILAEGSVDDTFENLWLFPDVTGSDNTDTFMALVATQTFTNKTATAANNNLEADDLICTNCIDDTEVTTNAGTALSADLEEEAQIAATAITGNAADDQGLVGTGASAATWKALPAGGTDGCSAAGDKPIYTASTSSWGCGTDAGGGAVKLFHSWPMWDVNPDGIKCKDITTQIVASGANLGAIQCDDDAASIIYFNVHDGDYAGGTVIVSVAAINGNASPTGIYDFDISAQCRGDDDLMNATWGTVQNFSITFATQNDIKIASTAVITPDGTCAANDMLFFRAVMDNTATTTEVADTRIFQISMVEQ